MNTMILGLDKEKTIKIANDLNVLLANFPSVLPKFKRLALEYQRERIFFELHVKFEEFYNDSQLKN